MDDRKKQKSLRENPEEPQNYYIKKTHIKYILREDHAEMTKVRIVRALENVDAITTDQYPGIFDEEPWKERPARVNPDFFSIPGVALKRGKYFLISLARDQVFKAGEDHSYMLSYEIPQPLEVLHSGLKEDSINIRKPLGTDELVVEVHFPTAWKFDRENGRVILKLYEVRDKETDEEKKKRLVEPNRYKIKGLREFVWVIFVHFRAWAACK